MEGETGTLSELFLEGPSDDIFSIIEAWELGNTSDSNKSFEFSAYETSENEVVAAAARGCKRQKVNGAAADDGRQRVSHITVERNRRKQMNHHLALLRTLMPSFYVKRGDQASIIGGVVEYIKELQQVLQSLESKKQRKDVLSPRFVSSPRKPPLSPRLSLPISPSTPQSSSPYKPWMHHLNSPSLPSPVSPCNSSASSSLNDAVNELVASSKSSVAQVEVKFSGPNLLLKTVSHRIPGQLVKIVSAVQQLALEILHVTIGTVDQTIIYSFTIKIGIECQLSAEDLAQQIQNTFCS